MTTILAAIFVFGIIVFIHEFGHFITDKLSGMQVDEFAIGFGPKIIRFQYGETLYTWRAIPLGGFNRIQGMTDDESLTDRSFLNQKLWKRFIVISAGAVFNFLLAIFIFFGVLATVGVPSINHAPVVGSVVSGSPAARAHVQANDRIISIQGQAISSWDDISPAFKDKANHVVDLVIERDGQEKHVSIIPEDANGRSIIGINGQTVFHKMSIGEAAISSVKNTSTIVYSMLDGLVGMIVGRDKAELAGPVGIAQMAGQVATVGFVYLLQFTALLSINLGIINLLPLPVLDGGHLILIIVEGITGKKLPTKVLEKIQMAGLALLLVLFIYTTFSDISRLL